MSRLLKDLKFRRQLAQLGSEGLEHYPCADRALVLWWYLYCCFTTGNPFFQYCHLYFFLSLFSFCATVSLFIIQVGIAPTT
jgi:hypothetical protein